MVWDLDDPFWYPATKQAYRTAKILNFDITVFAPKGRGEAGTLEMVHFLKKVLEERYDGICISPIADLRVEKLLQKMALSLLQGRIFSHYAKFPVSLCPWLS